MNTQAATQDITTVSDFQFTEAEFTAAPNGWRKYGPISVLDNGGSLISTGAFAEMDVYIEPTSVHWTTKENCQVMAPGPDPQWSPQSDFTYPEAGRFTIVATQCVDGLPQKGSNAKMEYTVIKPGSTSIANLQTIDLNGQKNIFFAFNDLAGAYADNSGELYVYVRLRGQEETTTVNDFQFTEAGFTAEPNGWRKYGPISVLDNGGSLISTGAFSKMDVYIEPTKVHWTTKENCFVMAPGPDPQWSPKSDFTYPNAGRFTIVATQCADGLPQKGSNTKVGYTVIEPSATGIANLQTIDLNSQKNIFFAFNDLAGAYADNSGEIYVHVKLYGEE